MRKLFAVLVMAGSIFSLGGCTTPASQLAAPDALASAAKSASIQDGKAHVYIFHGTFHRALIDGKVLVPIDVYANGSNIGGINKGDVLFVELQPGIYNFSWTERTKSSMAVHAEPVSFSLKADQNLFLALDMRTGVGHFFGAIGALAEGIDASINDRSSEGVATVQNLKVVLPNSGMVPSPIGGTGS